MQKEHENHKGNEEKLGIRADRRATSLHGRLKALLAALLCAMLALCSACGQTGQTETPADETEQTVQAEASADETEQTDQAQTPADAAEQTDQAETSADAAEQTGQAEAPVEKPTVDPSGASVEIPEDIESMAVLAPSIAQTVVALGQGDKVIGYDLNSVGIEGLPEDAPTFDMVNPDVEQLVALAPDVLLVSSLSLYDQENPYQPLIDAGVCVICIPTSETIADIKSDIEFLAAALGVPEEGEKILADFDAGLEEMSDFAAGIPDEERKTVYFEISAAPYLYSCGSGVYLNEMIELAGAKNILVDQSGWLSLEAETVVAADPDVILTNVNYIDDPVQEILGRDGWAGVSAVKNGQVYYIDNNASSQPNENILTAMREMARAIYPDQWQAYEGE